MSSIIVKEHRSREGKPILAIADKNIINKVFVENNTQLNLKSDFYKGEEKSKEEVTKLIKKAYILNVVGEESIKIIKNLNLIDNKSIIKIKGIPHTQVILLKE